MIGTRELREWFGSLPNQLTFARIAIIPVLMLLYPFDFLFLRVICSLLFLAAALTDLFDGFIARKYQLETKTGALLDPLADKLLVMAGTILVISSGNLWPWIGILLLGRDMMITGLRLIALERHYTIKVSQLGKYKTAFHLGAIVCLMINRDLFQIPFREIGMIAVWIALGLSLYSAYLYWLEFRKNLADDL